MTNLQEGDKAPLFCAIDQNNTKHCLKDYLGKKVVLYFYPNDDTPTCVKQACNLKDNISVLRNSGYTILGVSRNNAKSHLKYSLKYELPFSLLVDEDEVIVKKYGVLGEKQFMGRKFIGVHRVTFIINEQGIIDRIITKVKSAIHHHQILNNE